MAVGPFAIPTSTPLRSVPVDYCPPGSERWFTLLRGPDAGRTMFYSDHSSGSGQPRHTVLLIHGNPECSYTYRSIVQELVAHPEPVRIVALDHIGFGLSDQAGYEMVETHHAANLAELVSHLDLREVTLVVHDWGGPIGAGALLDDPSRVRALVVINSTIFPMPNEGITYENYPWPWLAWSWTPRLIPDRLWGGVAAYVVPHAEPQTTATFLKGMVGALCRYAARRVPAGTPEGVFSEHLRSPTNARSSKRLVRQTPAWGRGYRYTDPVLGTVDTSDFYRRLQDELPAAWRELPAAGFFGSWDPCGKAEVIEQWRSAFPAMDATSYPDNGHFLEEHRGAEIAAAIGALLQDASPSWGG